METCILFIYIKQQGSHGSVPRRVFELLGRIPKDTRVFGKNCALSNLIWCQLKSQSYSPKLTLVINEGLRHISTKNKVMDMRKNIEA